MSSHRHIVEYIGPSLLITTDHHTHRRRIRTPHPGDIVDFTKVLGKYPYDKPYGTVASFNVHGDGRVHFCCEPGSVYLGYEWGGVAKRTPLDRVSVSISGGPFESEPVERFTWTGEFRLLYCWNWGNHSPGEEMGVYYHIERPVFQLQPPTDTCQTT